MMDPGRVFAMQINTDLPTAVGTEPARIDVSNKSFTRVLITDVVIRLRFDRVITCNSTKRRYVRES